MSTSWLLLYLQYFRLYGVGMWYVIQISRLSNTRLWRVDYSSRKFYAACGVWTFRLITFKDCLYAVFKVYRLTFIVSGLGVIRSSRQHTLPKDTVRTTSTVIGTLLCRLRHTSVDRVKTWIRNSHSCTANYQADVRRTPTDAAKPWHQNTHSRSMQVRCDPTTPSDPSLLAWGPFCSKHVECQSSFPSLYRSGIAIHGVRFLGCHWYCLYYSSSSCGMATTVTEFRQPPTCSRGFGCRYSKSLAIQHVANVQE